MLNPSIDTHNYLNVNNPLAREKVLELMNDLQLLDYYRILHPNETKIHMEEKKSIKTSAFRLHIDFRKPLKYS